MRALPFSVCRWRCSSAAGAWSVGASFQRAHALAHQRDDLLGLVEEDRQQVEVDVVLDLALVLAGLEGLLDLGGAALGASAAAAARACSMGRRRRHRERRCDGSGTSATAGGQRFGLHRCRRRFGRHGRGLGDDLGRLRRLGRLGHGLRDGLLVATLRSASRTKPGILMCVPSPVLRDSFRPSRSARQLLDHVVARERHGAAADRLHHRRQRIDGAARGGQAARVELGREIDRVGEPLLQRVGDVGHAGRSRWCASCW